MNVQLHPVKGLQTTLRKMGNSTGLIVPKALLDQLGLASGAKIELRVEGGEVIARPVRRKVREGWAEDAARIGALDLTPEEGDWLEFDDPIEGDDDIPSEWLRPDPEQ
jgi:antitoxin MazE